MPPAVAIAAGAIVGGAAGSMEDKVKQTTDNMSGINLKSESDLEKRGTGMTNEGLTALQGMVDAGPGQSDVKAGYDQTNALSAMLSDYAKTGGAPGQQDWLQAQEYAKQQFAPQQMQLDQSFEQEKLRANQLAAQLGRPVNDPYIQAQLSKERMNQQSMMGAQQGAFMGQEARNNALSRLGYTTQLTDVKNSLASQAMANRQALLSLGQGIQASERNFRLATSNKWSHTNSEEVSGGGVKGMLTGAMAGASMGMGMGGGGGGGMPGMGGGGGSGGGGGGKSGGGMSSMGSMPMAYNSYTPQESMTQMPTMGQRQTYNRGGIYGRGMVS